MQSKFSTLSLLIRCRKFALVSESTIGYDPSQGKANFTEMREFFSLSAQRWMPDGVYSPDNFIRGFTQHQTKCFV